MSKSEELRQLADKFSEGWHEGIKIDAMDVMLLSDAASELETMQAILAQQPATGEPVGYMNEGHIHELAMGRIPYGYVYHEAGAGASTAVYTHPAPQTSDA